MSNCIPKILRTHLRFFSLIGYHGVSFSGDFKRRALIQNCQSCWSGLLLVLFNVMAFVALFSGEDFLFTGDKFGYFNDTLKVVFANIAVTVSFVETILKRSHIKRFWQIYDNLQIVGRNEKDLFDSNGWRENKRFLGIFYAFVFMETSVVIVFFIFQNITRHLILFWSIFTPLMYTVHLRNMQFIFYLEVLRLELMKLKQDLKLLVDYSNFVTYGCAFEGFEEFLRKNLLEKQKHYHQIYEMFEEFQNGFAFSMIAVLLMIYIRVLVDVYFAYYTFYRDWNKIGMLAGKMYRKIFFFLTPLMYRRNNPVSATVFTNSYFFNCFKKLHGCGECFFNASSSCHFVKNV